MKSSSSDKEEDIQQIITEEPKVKDPKVDKPMSNLPKLEFEAEYHFTHEGVTYQGYLNPTQEDSYQREIDTCIPGLKGDKLDAVKAALIDSLHCYPKKDRDKFLQPQYEYTPRDSATAAYKTFSIRIMGFSTGSTSSPPIPPKPQPPREKPKTQEGGMEQKIQMRKTLKAHTEMVVVEDAMGEEMVVAVEEVMAEEAQVDHLLDHLPDHFPDCGALKDYQESEKSKLKPLMSSAEIESEPKYSSTNSIWCSKEIQTSTKLTTPKSLPQCPTLKDQTSPGGGKTRSTTSDIMNSHATNGKTSLAWSSLQSIDSSMPYSGYMTSILMTLMPSQSSTDGSLNSFREATS